MKHATARQVAPAPRTYRLLLLAGLLAGFALRLYQLGAESFWYDETVSVYLARLPVAAMVAHTAGDIHPPGYYLLLHLWQALSRPTLDYGLEFLFAWPSAWWGMLLLPLTFALGRRLFSPPVALLALWLAAINPFQLWYSQEVRMYTLGALLGLLCFWALLQFLAQRNPRRWLAVYVLAAAAGLYILYYFALLLLALNLVALLWLWRLWRRLFLWLGAQLAVALLWLPWLPIFWRQLREPPVPPWRTPWGSISAFAASLAETLAAPLAGQSPPGENPWPWAIAGLILLSGAAVLASVEARHNRQRARAILALAIYIFLPVALLYTVTLLLTPVYHVRYLFIYLAPVTLLAALLIVEIARRHRWLAVATAAIVVAGSLLSLRAMWYDPPYRADDHRGAVAHLARAWQPGDAILVNAGWAYTILATYWPTAGISDDGSQPPPLASLIRLIDYANSPNEETAASPVVLRTGSVDGAPSLGWGNPNADFFAASRGETVAALDALATTFSRLWHYRLYDTVNDPDGVIRNWLATATTPLRETQIPGRDFGLLQLFDTGARQRVPPATSDGPSFGDVLLLEGHTAPSTVKAGTPLYTSLAWATLPGLAALPVPLSMSLRLYDDAGALVAQADAAPLPPTPQWQPGERLTQPISLPVPLATPPERYSLELIVYRQDDGSPLLPSENAPTADGQRLRLATVTVLP